ncbi:hypothetical protein LXL04_020855 [Taraxacum kok-saghyz]
MEEMYGFHSTSDYTISPENNLILPSEHNGFHPSIYHNWPFYGSEDLLSAAASVVSDAVSIETTPHQIILPRRRSNRQHDQAIDNGDGDESSGDTIKERIASHPSYFKLLDAYIDCQKVGAPPEIARLLDDIRLENDARKRNAKAASTCLGIDPELDEFMETYYHVLLKYKSDLERPFDEASFFFGNIKTQLRNLCKGAYTPSPSPNSSFLLNSIAI